MATSMIGVAAIAAAPGISSTAPIKRRNGSKNINLTT
jgi:hypothetical protein